MDRWSSPHAADWNGGEDLLPLEDLLVLTFGFLRTILSAEGLIKRSDKGEAASLQADLFVVALVLTFGFLRTILSADGLIKRSVQLPVSARALQKGKAEAAAASA